MTLLQDGALAAAFDRAAGAYDRLVGASPGYHRQLRLTARRLALPAEGEGLRVLDLGCGTGASTAALLSAAPRARVVAVDASAGMLERAAAKRLKGDVTFVHAPAEELGRAGVEGPFDAVLAAYLVRNLTAPDPVLRTVRSMLRPGGRLAVHEYSLSGARVHRLVWSAVCWGVIIPAGAAGAAVSAGPDPRGAAGTPGGSALYRHLWRSVLRFDTAPDLRRRLVRAGFAGVRSASVPGWEHGIVHTFLATRPLAGEAITAP